MKKKSGGLASGDKFGRLTAMAPTGSRGVKWVCCCKCGCFTVASRASLLNGSIKDCGCMELQRANLLLRKAIYAREEGRRRAARFGYGFLEWLQSDEFDSP